MKIWLLLLFLTAAPSLAEKPDLISEKPLSEKIKPKEVIPSVIEDLFKPVKHPWIVQGILEIPTYSFYVGGPSVKGVSYQPNVAPRIGTRILWKEWGTMLALSLPIPKSEQTRRGDSSQTNIVLNNYWRQWATDFYFQRFRGFYVSSPLTELQASKPGLYPQLPDAKVFNYGVNLYRSVSPQNYSLKAAFSQSEFQLKSGGSILFTFFFNHLEIDVGDRLFQGSDPNALNELPNLDKGRFNTLGAGYGYGYTHIRDDFFASALITAAPALQHQDIQKVDDRHSSSVSWAAKGTLNLSAGWNPDEYMGGAKILVDSLYSRVSGNEFWSSLISAQLFLGARF